MKEKSDQERQKPIYETPEVLASYGKEELEDVIGLDSEVEGNGGCGCSCGCSS